MLPSHLSFVIDDESWLPAGMMPVRRSHLISCESAVIRFGPKSETQETKPAKGKVETTATEVDSVAEKPAAKAAPKAKKPKASTDGTLL
jgi:hypothetical protein